MSRSFFVFSILFVLLFFGGCASHSELRKGMVDNTRLGYYEKSLKKLDALRKEASKKDRLMYQMDRGILLHHLGRYEESNQVLEAAKQTLDDLFTKDISDELAAIAWNDANRAFKGEEFERVMVHLISAFNYMQMGDLEAAGVEARQINHRLQVYADLLERNKVKTTYKQDPFAQFLAGLVHESLGDENAAFRSYEDALVGYETLHKAMQIDPPPVLAASLLRSARQLGYVEAVEKYEPEFGKYLESDPAFWEGKARLIVIANLGEIAHKKTEKWMIPDPQFDTIVVTYPKFVRGQFLADDAYVAVDDKRYHAGMVHDLSTLAIKMLDDKNAQVKGRAIAKAMARYAVKKVTKVAAMKSKNDTVKALSILANVAMNVYDVVEQADTRSWMTLPDHIRMTVVPVEPGHHTVTVQFGTRSDRTVDVQRFEGDFAPGDVRFLVVRARDASPSKAPEAQPVGWQKTDSETGRPIAVLQGIDPSIQPMNHGKLEVTPRP